MKYIIKTNIGLFPLDYDIISIHDDKVLILKNHRWVKYVDKSETIPELCDEFVLIENTRIPSKPVVMDIHKNGISDYFKNLKATIKCIYGAIWVDIKLPSGRVVKRLEPVAIMNEKGDWELL